jgi:hypothetical protein
VTGKLRMSTEPSHLINSRCASELQIWHDGKN